MSKCKFMRLTALFLSVIMLFNTVTMDVLATGTGEMETIKIEETQSTESASKDTESESESGQIQESETETVSGSAAFAAGALATDIISTIDESKLLSLEDYDDPVSIIGEDTSRRERNIKYFLNEDFSYTAAIYAGSVHYMENGQWKDIDNGLKAATLNGDSTYVENKANRMKVRFAQDTGKDRLVDIEIDGYKLSWGMDTGNRISTRRLTENTLDIRNKNAALIDDQISLDVELPGDEMESIGDEPLDVMESESESGSESESRSEAETESESESITGTESETEFETESETQSERETESGAETAIEAESESEIVRETETEGSGTGSATIETRETLANQTGVSGYDAETDTSLAPVDNEPVGENTTATLITENPDAAKMAAEGDTEGLQALEAASNVNAASSVGITTFDSGISDTSSAAALGNSGKMQNMNLIITVLDSQLRAGSKIMATAVISSGAVLLNMKTAAP